jgi:hypothetical protein
MRLILLDGTRDLEDVDTDLSIVAQITEDQ